MQQKKFLDKLWTIRLHQIDRGPGCRLPLVLLASGRLVGTGLLLAKDETVKEGRKGRIVEERVGTLNVRTTTDVMDRRKVDVLCMQETEWKVSKTRKHFLLFFTAM